MVDKLSRGLISWRLTTKPTVFGKDKELCCNLDDQTLLNRTGYQSKGENVDVLVVNSKTINDSRYSKEFHKAKITSILTITSLIGDVNVPFTCKHGLFMYKEAINMTVENFESHPWNKEASLKNEDGNMIFSVKFHQVFTVPTCRASYGEDNITNILIMSSVPTDLLFKVEISLKYNASKDCIHNQFYIICCIGTMKIKQRFETASDVCLEIEHLVEKDEKMQVPEKDQTIGTVGYVIFMLVFIFYCVFLPVSFAVMKCFDNSFIHN
ncbi:unnamed protein product [Mytilus coruscus]|uniref:Uncharacterized protein n=1 Tax=Mytilus coruscus TaxID=42192 RepID=A0A6J7ZWY2_MYTCO|nr:unnamed protein product [Mytilus coruscus]